MPRALLGALAVLLLGATGSVDLEPVRRLQAAGRWASSDTLATATLARLEAAPDPDSLAIADALFYIGQARWKLAAHADGVGLRSAGRCLGIRERRLGPETLPTAAAHVLVGRILVVVDRADSARFHVQRAIDIRTRLIPGDTLLADAWQQMGVVQSARRDFPAALQAYGRALEMRRRIFGPEHPEVADVLSEIGNCRYSMRDLDAARDTLQHALDIFTRALGPDAYERNAPLNYLATVENASGDFGRAMELRSEAIRVARAAKGDDDVVVMLLSANLANGLFEFGDYAGARASYAALLPRFEARYGRDNTRTCNVRGSLGISCLLTGDTAQALRLLREVETALKDTRPPAPTLAISLRWQGEALHRGGHHAEARPLAERAIATERSARRPWGTTLATSHYLLLSILEAQGDLAALDSVSQALQRLTDEYALGSTATRGTVRYWRARAARALGRDAEAWSLALEGEQMARELVRLNAQALPDRHALGVSDRVSRHLDLVFSMAGADSARLETAWDRLTRSRGLVSAEVARRRLPPGASADTALLALRSHWLEAQQRLARALVSGSGRDSAARAEIEGLRTRAETAENAYALARGAAAPPDPGLAEVRARLGPGQALVGFVETGAANDTGRVCALVARGGSPGVTRVELGRSAALRAALEPWREALSTPPGAQPGYHPERECRRLGLAARAAVWDPLAAALRGATDVFLVADGPLLDVAWAALPDGAGYLVERDARLHVLNAEREMLDTAPVAHGGALLAVGAPDYDHGAEAAPLLLASASPAALDLRGPSPDPCAGRDQTFAPLPGSGEEARAVAAAWGPSARTLTGAAASEAAFKSAAPGNVVLHVATHGVVARDTCAAGFAGTRGVGGVGPVAAPRAGKPAATSAARPAPPAPSPWMGRRVWLALAGANRAADHAGDENEGLLTAEEVLTLNLEGVEWVVLSACHSGLAEGWAREGAIGMRRAFELAGARTVIASQWAVEDESTRRWMAALYQARAAGAASAAEAIRAANRATLAERRHTHRSTHPFYWAAFAATGE